MSERKLLRYSHAFQQVLDATGNFTRTIDVPFTPDEVKVRQIGFYDIGTPIDVLSLTCSSLVGHSNSNLGFFVDYGVFFPGITYTLGRPMNGSHTFTVRPQLMNVADLDGAVLAVHLEFRKFV